MKLRAKMARRERQLPRRQGALAAARQRSPRRLAAAFARTLLRKKEYRPKRVIDPITPATWLAYSGRNT